jgi:sec-independent protein translocase protein TatA
MFGTIGYPEIIFILVVILLLFGAKRLPELGRSLGRGLREFKDGLSGLTDTSETSSTEQASAEKQEKPDNGANTQ